MRESARQLVGIRGALLARLQPLHTWPLGTWPLGAAVACQLLVLLLIRRFVADPTGGDLCQDAVTTHRLLSGLNPYTPITACSLLRHSPHPPAWLLLITPFTILPVPLAAALWDLVGLAALAVVIAMVVDELRLRPGSWQTAAGLAFVIFWPPLLSTLLEAQASLVLLLLIALAWRWARQGKGIHAGAALGLAAALRLFPALLVVYFAFRRDWRAVAAAAISFSLASLALFPVVGLRAYVDFVTREAPAATAEWIESHHNASLSGLAYHFLSGNGVLRGTAPLVGQALSAALVMVLLCFTYLRRRIPFVQDEATFLAYVPAALLISPLMWSYYYVLLLLPLAVLAARLGWLAAQSAVLSRISRPRAERRRQLAGLVALAIGLIWLSFGLKVVVLPDPVGEVAGSFTAVLETSAVLVVFAALLVADGKGPPFPGDVQQRIEVAGWTHGTETWPRH